MAHYFATIVQSTGTHQGAACGSTRITIKTKIFSVMGHTLRGMSGVQIYMGRYMGHSIWVEPDSNGPNFTGPTGPFHSVLGLAYWVPWIGPRSIILGRIYSMKRHVNASQISHVGATWAKTGSNTAERPYLNGFVSWGTCHTHFCNQGIKIRLSDK